MPAVKASISPEFETGCISRVLDVEENGRHKRMKFNLAKVTTSPDSPPVHWEAREFPYLTEQLGHLGIRYDTKSGCIRFDLGR